MNIISVNSSLLITILGWACVLSLTILLIFKELLRAYNGPRTDVWMRKLNFAITPLLMLFSLIIVSRLIQML